MKQRCSWPEGTSEEMVAYHDNEWGVPVRDDRKLFHNFDFLKCSRMTDTYIEKILTDPSIIRNRLKVFSVRKNALAATKVMEELGSFSDYLWSFTGGQPIVNRIKKMSDIPATSPESDAMSKDMKKRGFTFAGSTICYAFMQGVGMVNDHEVVCFRYKECRM